MYKQRPLGIAILAVLEIIGGILALIIGIAFVAAGSMFESMMSEVMPFYGLFTGIFAIIGAIVIVVAIIALLLGYGLWKGSGWAWILQLIFSALGAVTSLTALPSGIVGLIIDGLIIWYLFRPNVKAFFGKGEATPTQYAPPQYTTPPPPPPP
jgi:lysylphosphatidylglycerol synthetase-like protein (DUF2156 family)